MTEEEYVKSIDDLILDFAAEPDRYPTADDIVKLLDPDQSAKQNLRVQVAAKTILKISPDKFRAAMIRHEKSINATLSRMDHEQAVIAALGVIPKDEREYVAALIQEQGYTMRYDGEFHRHGKPVPVTALSNDLILTASTLGLSRPRGKVLTDSRIETALNEWMYHEKEARRIELWDAINTLPDGKCRDSIMFSFATICEWYFAEPEYATASLLKFIWQVKRKMLGLPIKEHHMVVIQGAQLAGKTDFCRKLTAPVKEMSAETDVSQIVDDRNFSLREHFVVFIDEMSKAEQADVSKLKNIITGIDNVSRVLYTHRTQRITINMTLIATANLSLGGRVYDTTGMRRFVEIQPKLRSEVPEERWRLIETHDYLAVWQAVDPYADDPMLPFDAILREKQEELRARDNVEAWLDQFDVAVQTNQLDRIEYRPNHFAEFYGQPLYDVFRTYEQRCHPASHGTSITKWGREMKALIHTEAAKDWSVSDKKGKRVRYRLQLSNVVDLTGSAISTRRQLQTAEPL